MERRSFEVGRFTKRRITGEVSREKGLCSVTNFRFGGLQPINHPADVCVQQTAQSFCPDTLISDNNYDAGGRASNLDVVPAEKGQNVAGRKRHCVYVQVDDNKKHHTA